MEAILRAFVAEYLQSGVPEGGEALEAYVQRHALLFNSVNVGPLGPEDMLKPFYELAVRAVLTQARHAGIVAVRAPSAAAPAPAPVPRIKDEETGSSSGSDTATP